MAMSNGSSLISGGTTQAPPNQNVIPSTTTPVYSKCGHSTYYNSGESPGGIIGGVRAQANQYPWMVFLLLDLLDGTTTMCGGTLVNRWYVLTSAYCLSKVNGTSGINVIVAENSLSNTGGSDADQFIVGAQSFTLHPQYSSATYQNDLAMIRLSQYVNFTSTWHVQSICLPASTTDTICSTGTNVWVAGWGVTDTTNVVQSDWLMTAYVKVIDISTCSATYLSGMTAQISSNQMCAGYSTGGAGSCLGDEGGPLMTNENGYFQICGVYSFSKGCAAAGYPAIYTKVAPYLNWINQVISSSAG